MSSPRSPSPERQTTITFDPLIVHIPDVPHSGSITSEKEEAPCEHPLLSPDPSDYSISVSKGEPLSSPDSGYIDQLPLLFIPLPSEEIPIPKEVPPEMRMNCIEIAKKIATFILAFISAIPFSLNAGMAGINLMAFIEGYDAQTLGDIFENGGEGISTETLILSLLLALASLGVNIAQAYDYIPKMWDDFQTLRSLQGPFSKKKAALYFVTLLSFASAIIMGDIALSSVETIENVFIRDFLGTLSAIVSGIMTMATRFVSSKKIVDECAFLYEKEEGFLLTYLKELIFIQKNPVLEKPFTLTHSSPDLLPNTESLLMIFEKYGISIPADVDLNELVSQYQFRKEHPPKIPYKKIIGMISLGAFVGLCTLGGTETFAEKLAALIPPCFSEMNAILWDGFRFFCGSLGALPSSALYFLAASDLITYATRGLLESPGKTTFSMVVNAFACLSMFNVALGVSTNTKKPPIIPLPKKNHWYGLLFPAVNAVGAFNVNFRSYQNKFVIPPKVEEDPLTQQIELARQKIIKEHEPSDKEQTKEEIRCIQRVLFFNSSVPSHLEEPLLVESSVTSEEKPKHWARFRQMSSC